MVRRSGGRGVWSKTVQGRSYKGGEAGGSLWLTLHRKQWVSTYRCVHIYLSSLKKARWQGPVQGSLFGGLWQNQFCCPWNSTRLWAAATLNSLSFFLFSSFFKSPYQLAPSWWRVSSLRQWHCLNSHPVCWAGSSCSWCSYHQFPGLLCLWLSQRCRGKEEVVCRASQVFLRAV